MIVRPVDWDDPAGVQLRAAQRVEIEERYGTPDSEPGPAPTADDITVFLVAFETSDDMDGSRDGDASDRGTPIGCGGLREIDSSHGEIKRMFVRRDRRGSGVSTLIIRALEQEARDRGWDRLVLETGDRQPDAVRFYEREGYVRIPNFGHYEHNAASLCFGRSLV